MAEKKDKTAVREAKWAERLSTLAPEKREKRLAKLRERAAELDAMSPDERAKAKEDRKSKKAGEAA
jgi:hypothetical protein